MPHKFYRSYILLFIMFIFAAQGCADKDNNSDIHSILTVGINPDYPPFEFHRNSKLVGYDVDLMQAIGTEMGIAIQFQEMSFPNLMGALQTHKINVAISGMTITADRLKNVNFSIPYYQSSLAILYRKDKMPPDIHHLSNVKMGVQLGSTMEKWLKNTVKNSTNIEIMTLDTNSPLIEKLKLGQIDYLVIEALQAIEFSKVNSMLTYKKMGPVAEGYGIALPKNSPYLDKINHAIQQLQENGTLLKLEQKWLGEN